MLGHLHTDHSGGPRIFQGADVELVVHEAEYHHVRNMPEPAMNFFNKVDCEVLEHASRTLVTSRRSSCCRGGLVHLPGHTPGLMGMKIELAHSGTVLLTTDAMYRHETYEPPCIGSQTVWDSGKWRESLEKIRRIATDSEALIFPGHDGEAIKQFATHTELRQFEFTPDFSYS